MIPLLDSGLVLGKFMPPHAGHLHLIGCARRQVRRLWVVVERIAHEPIPSTLRVQWLRELVPEVEVLHLDREMPQAPSECLDFWPRWRAALQEILPVPPQLVFASEDYGHRLAQELGARFLPVDPGRQVLPISATLVRAQPAAQLAFLPAPVRAYYGIALPQDSIRGLLDQQGQEAVRVAIIGPESTGKTTLARKLAATFGALWVPEHAHTMIAAGAAAADLLTIRDFEDFARGQRASEDQLASSQSGQLLFCDSDALTTRLYAQMLLGACPAWIVAEANTRQYALTLLTAPDTRWVDDIHRVAPTGRQAFFRQCEAELQALGRRYVVLAGSWEERFESAVRAVQSAVAKAGAGN